MYHKFSSEGLGLRVLGGRIAGPTSQDLRCQSMVAQGHGFQGPGWLVLILDYAIRLIFLIRLIFGTIFARGKPE